MYKKLLATVLLIVINGLHAGELLLKNNSTGCDGTILFDGIIKKGDSDYFETSLLKLVNERKCGKSVRIDLNSDGGDVDEALKIGRMIRKNEYRTGVNELSHHCHSSCVFILAAGVSKWSNFGQVGIHRPYFSDLSDNLSMAQIKVMRDRRIKQLREYFEYVDVPQNLLELMLSIEPEDIKILSNEEKSLYRLHGLDASYEEKLNARAASLYNLSSSEYRARKVQADAECRTYTGGGYDGNCILASLLKISVQEVARRRARAAQFCPSSLLNEKENCVKKYVVLGQ